jgi:hypothetical protein
MITAPGCGGVSNATISTPNRFELRTLGCEYTRSQVEAVRRCWRFKTWFEDCQPGGRLQAPFSLKEHW